MSNSLEFVTVLLEDLQTNDDDREALESLGAIRFIAQQIGASNTRDILLPTLLNLLPTFGNDALYIFSAQLANFVPLVGGPEHAHVLVDILSMLLGFPEMLVHEKAAESLTCVLAEMNSEDVSIRGFDLIKKSTTSEEFQIRIACCRLFPAVYPCCTSNQKQELLSFLTELSKDNVPLVKRAVAHNLPSLFLAVEPDSALNVLLPILIDLTNDESLETRATTVQPLVSSIIALPASEVIPLSIPALKQLGSDNEWLVRLAVCKQWRRITQACGREVCQTYLVNTFTNRLQDPEMEIRKQISSSIYVFASNLSTEVLKRSVLPALQVLATDPAPAVRANTAKGICLLTPLMGSNLASQKIVTMVNNFLVDEDPFVSEAAARYLHLVFATVNNLASSPLFETFRNSLRSSYFHTRGLLLLQVPFAVKILGRKQVDVLLTDVFEALVCNTAFVRRMAAFTLGFMSRVLPQQMIMTVVIPKLIDISNSTHYLHRQNALLALGSLVNLGEMFRFFSYSHSMAYIAETKVGFKRAILGLNLYNISHALNEFPKKLVVPERLSTESFSKMQLIHRELQRTNNFFNNFENITIEDCVNYDVFLMTPAEMRIAEIHEVEQLTALIDPIVQVLLGHLHDSVVNVRQMVATVLYIIVPAVTSRTKLGSIKGALSAFSSDVKTLAEIVEAVQKRIPS
ncbi:hypothetical protein PCE1_004202 [Barthelona sp. PCE]